MPDRPTPAITLVQGDITAVEVDAVVNAANSSHTNAVRAAETDVAEIRFVLFGAEAFAAFAESGVHFGITRSS